MSRKHDQSIQVRLVTNLKDSTNDIQLVPCSIDHNGEAKLDEYFKVEKEGDVLVSSFRGRPLKGLTTNIPSTYKGLVMKESVASNSEETDREFIVQDQFDVFTHWELDHAPTGDNCTKKSFDWLSLADALHSAVLPESNGEKC
ncbi:ribonuclease H2 subunit C-like [Watersipora subatra]|uniref:ribonuclease H2 subunit C-like n=1 Tax=Watersipora subatra TaxID=2589382 RepID=UPI00355C62E9